MKRSLVITIVSGILISGIFAADARQWKPSTTQMASDYLTIEHQKSENEFVLVMWMAPAMLGNTPEVKQAREFLSTYPMFLVAHAEITPLGEWKFIDPVDVVVETVDGEVRKPISSADLPPLLNTMQQYLSQILAQGMGQLGQNATSYVFAGQGINECKEGAIWLRYAGERYEYKTPVPGCG